jgi:hypothetical protein
LTDVRRLVVAALLLSACSSSGRSSGDGGSGNCGAPGTPFDTTVVGTVFAPNGQDPVPNATVYVPTGAPSAFPAGVSCDLCGVPSGAVTSTTTRFDGGFTLPHVPPGENVKVVIELGRFRRVVTMSVTACQPNLAPHDPGSFGVRLPGKDGDLSVDDRVPKIAVATGDYDQIECVLKRMGIEQIDLYDDRYQGTLPATQGKFFDLLNDRAKLEAYNLVVVNCTYSDFEPKLTPAVLANLEHYVGAGGRLYATDWAYDFIGQVPAFAPYLCYVPGGVDGSSPPTSCPGAPQPMGTAHSNTPWSTAATPRDPTLTSWLGVFPSTLVNGQVAVAYNFVVIDRVGDPQMYPTTVWLDGDATDPNALPQLSKGTRPMTVTFDYKQCGRVHYSTYNTEPNAIPADTAQFRYPGCDGRTAFNPQERLLEYLIFETAQCVGPIG